MNEHAYTITLPDGSQAIVRTAKPGYRPSAADIDAIMALREALLERRARWRENGVDPDSVCPGCGCFRDRCACDIREVIDACTRPR